HDISLGLVLYTATGKYAFSGSGDVTLLGLTGLLFDHLTTQFGLVLNRTGNSVTETVPGFGQLTISDTSGMPQFQIDATISFPGLFEVRGTVGFRQQPGGQADVEITSAKLKVFSGNDTAFEIGGRATFKIGGAEGFRLQDFRINDLKIFDFSLSLPGNTPQD